MKTDFAKILRVLERLDMDVLYVHDAGEHEARNICLGLPVIHDPAEIGISTTIRKAAGEALKALASHGLLNRHSRLYAEWYLEGVPFPNGGAWRPSGIRCLRTTQEYRQLNWVQTSHEHGSLKGYVLSLFRLDGQTYMTYRFANNPITLAWNELARHEVPLVPADHPYLSALVAKWLRGERTGGYSPQQFEQLARSALALRIEHFARQLFGSGDGLSVLVAGVGDFFSPESARRFNRCNKSYLSAVHKAFLPWSKNVCARWGYNPNTPYASYGPALSRTVKGETL